MILISLSIAIGFSWSGFISIFSRQPEMAAWPLALACVSTSICLAALALVATGGALAGITFALIGLALASAIGSRVPQVLSLPISLAGFAIYVNDAGI